MRSIAGISAAELPKELLSTITFTTHLLPSSKIKTGSHREHPPDFCKMSSSISINSYDENTDTNFTRSALSFSTVLNHNKNEQAQQQQQKIKQILHQPHQKQKVDGNGYNYLIVASTNKSNDFKTKIFSSTSVLREYKVSHRKKKSNNNNNNIFQIVAATMLRHVFSLHTTTASASSSVIRHVAPNKAPSTTRTRFRLLPSFGATSFFTLLTLVCLETVLLPTMSNCAKTFYMHWNTSNSIFRIDNTDHIIDVNKGNLAFEFDQVHIICPVYEPGTFENETEKYIIYNVSKVEYETCRITNADPRVIAICDKPQKLMFFTISFRPFTPQPGGLEFLPGNDYYFISTSSKDDLYRRIGGRCSTNNMKVVFKVCCAPDEKNKTSTVGSSGSNAIGSESNGGSSVDATGDAISGDTNTPTNINQQHINNINTVAINNVNTGSMPGNGNTGLGGQLKPISGTSINTNIDQFNRIPLQTNGINVIGGHIGSGSGLSGHVGNGILLTPGHNGINMIPTASGGMGQFPSYPGQTSIRINNIPLHPPHNYNNNNDDHYDKHPNEVVKNEELTYNSAASTLHSRCSWIISSTFVSSYLKRAKSAVTTLDGILHVFETIKKVQFNNFLNLNKNRLHFKHIILDINPMIMISMLLITIIQFFYNYTLSLFLTELSTESLQICVSAKSSYLPVNNSEPHNKRSINNKNFR